MTPEQKKVVKICGDRLKKAFLDKTGYLKFNFDNNTKFVYFRDVHEYWKVEE